MTRNSHGARTDRQMNASLTDVSWQRGCCSVGCPQAMNFRAPRMGWGQGTLHLRFDSRWWCEHAPCPDMYLLVWLRNVPTSVIVRTQESIWRCGCRIEGRRM